MNVLTLPLQSLASADVATSKPACPLTIPITARSPMWTNGAPTLCFDAAPKLNTPSPAAAQGKPMLLLPGAAMIRRVSEVARTQLANEEPVQSADPIMPLPIPRKKKARVGRTVSFHEETQWVLLEDDVANTHTKEIRPLDGTPKKIIEREALTPGHTRSACKTQLSFTISEDCEDCFECGDESPKTTRNRDTAGGAGGYSFAFAVGDADDVETNADGASSEDESTLSSPVTPRPSTGSSPSTLSFTDLPQDFKFDADSPRVHRHRTAMESFDLQDKHLQSNFGTLPSKKESDCTKLDDEFCGKTRYDAARFQSTGAPCGRSGDDALSAECSTMDQLPFGLHAALACGP